MKNNKGKYAARRLMVLCACGCRKPLSIYHEKNRGDFLEAHWEKYWAKQNAVARKAQTPRKPRKVRTPYDPYSKVLRYVTNSGYVLYKLPSHPTANKHGYVWEHRLLAERALGRSLDVRHPVHHVDSNKANNTPSNLVICEDEAYHRLLHQRAGTRYFGGRPSVNP